MNATSRQAKHRKELEAEEAEERFRRYAQRMEDEALGNPLAPISDGTEDRGPDGVVGPGPGTGTGDRL